MFGSPYPGGFTVYFFEGPGKMKGIAVPDGACDILDGEPGKLQKFCGFDHPVLYQEFLGRLSQGLAEEGAEVAAVQAAVPGDVFHGYIILEVLFNEGDGFFDIEVLDLPAGSALKGSHGAGQVIQEQKAVAQEMVGGFFAVVDYVEHLRPDIVLERFVSQSPKELLIAPDWGLKNYEFNHRVQKRMKELGAYQGKKYEM